MLVKAMDALNERERDIMYSRRLQDPPLTLEDLSSKYDISRERVRQIEEKAFEKLQKRMKLLVEEKKPIMIDYKKS
jgi:RNA polymerase sigma-32 factor